MAYIGNNPFSGFAPFTIDTFVGNGVTLTFTLSQPRPVNPRSILVVIDGVTQPAVSAYNLDGNLNLEFTEAPPNDSILTVVHMHLSNGSGGGTASPMVDTIHPAEPFDELTFDGTNGPFQLQHSGSVATPYNEYYTLIYVAGQFKRPLIDYTINVNGQITFIGTPPLSSAIFYGLNFGKITLTEVMPGSLSDNAFGISVDFGSRDVRVDDPQLGRQIANKRWVEDSFTAEFLNEIPNNTDELPEAGNLYFTVPRVRASLIGDGLITYNSITGTIGITLPEHLVLSNQRIDTNASPIFIGVTATSDMTAETFIGDLTGDVTGQISDISNHNTDELVESLSPVNKWFTDQRAQDSIESLWVHTNHTDCEVYRNPVSGEYEIRVVLDSDLVPEGPVNKYFTLARFNEYISEITIPVLPDVDNTVDLGSNAFRWNDIWLAGQLKLGGNTALFNNLGYLGYTPGAGNSSGKILKTTDLEEMSTARFFTEARVRAAVTVGTGLTYVSTTGAFSLHSNAITASDSINKLYDVDTATIAPVTSDVLMWDGTKFRPGRVPIRTTSLGNISGNTSLNASLSTHFNAIAIGAITFSLVFDSGNPLNMVWLELTNGGAFTINWPVSVKWPEGIIPVLTTSGVDILMFISYNGGITWRGSLMQKDSR